MQSSKGHYRRLFLRDRIFFLVLFSDDAVFSEREDLFTLKLHISICVVVVLF